MRKLQVVRADHSIKQGAKCVDSLATVTDSCEIWDEDEYIGVYLRGLKSAYPKLSALTEIADREFISKRVPKTLLERSDVLQKQRDLGITRAQAKKLGTVQYSTILGSIPPKPVFQRNHISRSAVHLHEEAKNYIKAMYQAAKEIEAVYKEVIPHQYNFQKKAVSHIEEKWRFGELFTSTISNYNIAAPYHRDKLNIEGSCNAIITKRKNSRGGSLSVPDYGAVFEQADDSLLIYPAWRNIHGVTPIIPTHDGGYRNSFIWYALKAFLKNNG